MGSMPILFVTVIPSFGSHVLSLCWECDSPRSSLGIYIFGGADKAVRSNTLGVWGAALTPGREACIYSYLGLMAKKTR